jgi:Rrf2 family protein
MLRPQKKEQYALRAIFELAKHEGKGPTKISEIAEAQSIPGSGLIDSKRGFYGGYYLIQPPHKITVGDILRFLQGPEDPADCSACISKTNCPFNNHCAFASMWQEVKDAIFNIYDQTTMQDLLDLQRAGIFVTITILSIFIMGLGVRKVPPSSDEAARVRADIITIDYLKTFGKLERPAVIFLHDKHTAALEKKNKDCQTCHLSENNRLIPKFKRLKDTDKTEVMDIFHTQCIACHRETAANKEKSGPVSCGDCHKDEITVSSSRCIRKNAKHVITNITNKPKSFFTPKERKVPAVIVTEKPPRRKKFPCGLPLIWPALTAIGKRWKKIKAQGR